MWYLARGAGIVSLLLLTGSVLLGILTSVRWMSDRWPRFTTTYLHRNLSLLAVVFLVLHVATVVIDGFAPIRWLDVVIPFASPYRPFWLGLGTIAFDLVLALVATSLLRHRIGPRLWRTVHWLAYACWPVAVVHGMGTGTDTASQLFLVVDGLCIAAVILAVWWRVRPQIVQRPAVRGWVLAVTIVAPIALLGWLFDGPLATGWARRAGTPAALLAQTPAAGAASAAASVPSASVAPQQPLGTSFQASFRGSVARSDGGNQAETLQFDAPVSDGAGSKLVVVLQGTNNGAGLVVRSGTAIITSSGSQPEFSGTVTAIENGTLYVSPSPGSLTTLTMQIRIDQLDIPAGTVNGSVRAAARAPASGDSR
jgi:sulfoxide reductase heme-binding subunit YedZ